MNGYLKTSKRLDEVLEKPIFWLSNVQILDWLNISESTRKRVLRDLKDLHLIPDTRLRGLNRDFLFLFWEYHQLLKLTDRPSAYLSIKKLIEDIKKNDE